MERNPLSFLFSSFSRSKRTVNGLVIIIIFKTLVLLSWLHHERAGMTNYTNLGSFSAFFNRVFSCARGNGADAEYGRWNELAVDLFEKIVRDLDAKSIVAAKSVCKSWHSAITRARIEIPTPSPWLVCPSNFFQRLYCYDCLDRNVTATIKLPKSIRGGGEIYGSSKGWLVVSVKKTRLLLFDPLSGAQHELPSLATIPYFSPREERGHRLKPLGRFRGPIELSSSDVSECVVAILTRFFVACCRPKDKKWTIYDGYNHSSQSALCVYATFCHQTLYIGLCRSQTRNPFVTDCKITAKSDTVRLNSGGDDDEDEHGVQYLNVKVLPCFDAYASYYSDNYLTESNNKQGEQLILALIVLDHTAPFSGYHAVTSLKLLELTPCIDDDQTGNTFYVRSVSSLGDREIMFSGPQTNFFVHSASAKLARDKENCICHVYSFFHEHYVDVYDIVDRKQVQSYPGGPIRRRSCWFWFTPNLRV